MQLGASFSHRHLQSLGYDPLTALKELASLGLKWIRLGCYWDEIEKEPGKFTFQALDPLIKFCTKEKINLVLTVGIKAPRYPEYYLPKWLAQQVHFRRLSTIDVTNKVLLSATSNFIKNTIEHFQGHPTIKVWQVENEPLDWSGEKWWKITPAFLKKEVILVKKLDPTRKILINLWGNELSKRELYKEALKLADIIGFDFYLRHPMFFFFNFFNRYIGPLDKAAKIKEILCEVTGLGKEIWITELQAEPWEVAELHTKKDNPPSFLPKHFAGNLDYGKSLDPSVIFLWGFEWWYDRKQKGDLRYWQEAQKAINSL